ncbi:MAG: type II secretion system protein [Candidatus Gastranaerophilales bacterium]
MFKFKKAFTLNCVIPYLIRNHTVERYNDDETLKQVQGDKATRPGFTLAEVLITLGIIGVVSAMTIPNLISNYQSEALSTKKTLFQERLYEAMNQMRFHEKLTGYSDAEDFVEELGKYLKINETCDLTDMTDCFPDVAISSCDEKVYVEDLKTGENFAANILNRNFKSDNVGIVLADGTKAIINYDLDCEWLAPYESGLNRTEATQCVAIIADMNGNAGKNTVGSDIVAINSSLGIMIEDTCWDTANISYSSINTCDGQSEYDSNFTSSAVYEADPTYDMGTKCSSNNWAGAKKVCEDAGKTLPSLSQWAYFVQYVFDLDYVPDETKSVTNVVMNETKANELSMGGGINYRLWTSYETGNVTAYQKTISSTASGFDGSATETTNYTDNFKSAGWNARCVR